MSEITKNTDEENLSSYSSNTDNSNRHNPSDNNDYESRRMTNWSDLAAQLIEKLTGKNLQVTYAFDNLEIEIPKAYGPGGKQLGGATWKIDGKIIISIAHIDKNKSFSSDQGTHDLA